MRLRSTHILLTLVALLALLGVGGAVFVGGNSEAGKSPQVAGGLHRPPQTAQSTPVRMVAVATAGTLRPTSTMVNPPVGTMAAVVESASVSPPTVSPPTMAMPIAPTIVAPTDVAAVPSIATAPPLPSTPAPAPTQPSKPTVAPQVKVLAAPTAILPTSVPIPPVPREERIGGPVDVPNEHDGPRWVTLQIGHYRNENFPPELSHLKGNTGASAAGVTEVGINEAVTRKTAAYLIERGYKVDILDATVPIGYVTDLFLSIHADGNQSSALRGFKATAPWNSPPASEEFVRILYEEYGQATGLPTDPVTSVGMADYYAFNPVTYRHALDPRVPGTLLEMGFVTNPEDRRVMTQEQHRLAWGITNAIDRYFRSGAAGAIPTPYPTFTPTVTPTFTPTSTSTPTPTHTSTPTETATPVPTELADGATATAALVTPSPTLPPTATPRLPVATRTPIPTPTPLRGIITGDGRWLPPLSSHVRGLPQPGSSAPPVLLDTEDDEHLMTASGRDQIQNWQQFYIPELGRSIWRQGPLRPIRH